MSNGAIDTDRNRHTVRVRPGSPTTLSEHVERSAEWTATLWGAENMDLHMCDGTVRLQQRGLFQNIREDAQALRVWCEAMHHALCQIADADEALVGNSYARLQSIAQSVVGTKIDTLAAANKD